MDKRNMDLPIEGQIVIVTGKIEENMQDRIGDPVGTCFVITKAIVGVVFETGDMWWGKPREVFIYEGPLIPDESRP